MCNDYLQPAGNLAQLWILARDRWVKTRTENGKAVTMTRTPSTIGKTGQRSFKVLWF